MMMTMRIKQQKKLVNKRQFLSWLTGSASAPEPKADPIAYLKEGNKRFVDGKSKVTPASAMSNLKKFSANGQTPKTCILCCSDSRAPVEKVFDLDLGELFVTRVAGNIPVTALIGSIEYAVATFGSDTIVVLGHTKCGAVAATISTIETGAPLPSDHLKGIVGTITPNASAAAKSTKSQDEKMAAAIEANVIGGIEFIKSTSAILGPLIASKKLTIHGGIFDLDTGLVRFL